MESAHPTPKLVASTTDTYCCSVSESRERERGLRNGASEGSPAETINGVKISLDLEMDSEVNYFKSAQWTPDGTTLLTSSADNTIRTFITPPTLLTSQGPHTLMPYTTHSFPTSINCLAPYPLFTLSTPQTTVYLSTPTSLPIRLLNIFSSLSTPQASYPLICPTTETYLTPSSLLWPSPGHNFYTGTDCLVALFDVSRNGEGPVTRMPTIPSKRHKMKGGGVGMRGLVSALSNQENAGGEGILAAGTYTRWVSLYDSSGLGGTISTFSIESAADEIARIGGSGVTQVCWSPCGRYLMVVERKSEGVLVYDIRVLGQLVGWLEGREAMTNQRVGVDVFQGEEGTWKGTEVWAGGTDGVVRVWKGVGMKEGGVERDWEWRAHEDAVSSTIVHSSGTVVATCSGQRSEPELELESGSDEDESENNEEDFEVEGIRSRSPKLQRKTPDNSIKIWSL